MDDESMGTAAPRRSSAGSETANRGRMVGAARRAAHGGVQPKRTTQADPRLVPLQRVVSTESSYTNNA